MSHYSNPTANAAIGAVDREIRMMRKRAEQIKRRHQQGLLTPRGAGQGSQAICRHLCPLSPGGTGRLISSNSTKNWGSSNSTTAPQINILPSNQHTMLPWI